MVDKRHKDSFDQMATPVLEIIDGSLYSRPELNSNGQSLFSSGQTHCATTGINQNISLTFTDNPLTRKSMAEFNVS
jgi:hypothetical protein